MNGSDTLKILFAGGGTAGHLMPAINIAAEMIRMNKKVQPLFVGKKDGIERDIIGRYGYITEEIDVIGMRRTPMGIIKFALRWNVGNRQALRIIKNFDPVAVVGTGGYVSAPVIRAAHKLNRKIFLQEQNSLPGLALRSVARYADLIFLAYESAAEYFDSKKSRLIGNPVRPDIAARDKDDSKKKFNLDPLKKTLLILGGSSGASGINETVLDQVIGSIADGWEILWQTGNRHYNKYYEKTSGKLRGAIFPFIDDMPSAYAAADLVLSRAGAMALSEITAVGLPSVLIPYPHATGDHQTLNARRLEKRNASVILSEAEITANLSRVLIELMTDDAERKKMRIAALSMGKPDAARVIAEMILEQI